MFAGASGYRRMRRKIAGSAMITMEPSRLDMNTAIVVFVSAAHRYRSASEERGLTVRGGSPGWLLIAPPTVTRLAARKLFRYTKYLVRYINDLWRRMQLKGSPPRWRGPTSAASYAPPSDASTAASAANAPKAASETRHSPYSPTSTSTDRRP